MDGLFKNAGPSALAKLFVPFVASGFLGCVLIWSGLTYCSEFIKALGDAFIIAAVIGLCIELFAASQIIEHASHEMAARMAGQWLPKAAGDLLYHLVRDTRFVYRDYRKMYRIIPKSPGFVTLCVTLSYRIVNNGKRSERYRPALHEEGMYSPTVISFQYRKIEVATADLQQDTLVGGVRAFYPKKHIRIRPSDPNTAKEDLRDDQNCLVRWTYQIEMPEYYSDVTAFAGMTVEPLVELLDKPEDLEFWATEDNSCRHVGSTWTYQQAFIGGQHVRAWWRPKRLQAIVPPKRPEFPSKAAHG